MTVTARSRTLTFMYACTVVVALGMIFSGHYPPMQAQTPPARSSDDQRRDDRLDSMEKHIDHSDQITEETKKSLTDQIAAIWASIYAMKQESAHNGGMFEAFGIAITLLSSGSLIVNIRKK